MEQVYAMSVMSSENSPVILQITDLHEHATEASRPKI